MPIYVSNRQIVVPGDVIAEGKYEAEGSVYVENKKYIATSIGLVELERGRIRVVPLKGKYIPSVGDVVIGKIVDVGTTSWSVDINSPYTAILQVSEVFSRPTDALKVNLAQVLNVGDLVVAKVIAFDLTRDPLLTIKESRLGKVTKGTLVEITPTKVPRVIGKKGSMLKILKDYLDVEVVVGKNGRILVIGEEGEREAIAALAIKKIEREAHVSGLTERIKRFIEQSLREAG